MSEELVRVRIGTGANTVEKNMGRTLAEMASVTILDEPTHDATGAVREDTGKDGRPLKPRVSVDEAAEQKATSRSASTQKKE